jgi:hypothetical protein
MLKIVFSLFFASFLFVGIGFYSNANASDNDKTDSSYFNQGHQGGAYQGLKDTYQRETGKNPDDVQAPEVGQPVPVK